MTPVSPRYATPSAENVGLSEGQEGSWLLPEYPGADADMQVGSSIYHLVKLFGATVPPLLPLPVLVLLSWFQKQRRIQTSSNDRKFSIRTHAQQQGWGNATLMDPGNWNWKVVENSGDTQQQGIRVLSDDPY